VKDLVGGKFRPFVSQIDINRLRKAAFEFIDKIDEMDTP